MIMAIGVRVTMGQLSRRRIPDFGNTHSKVQAFARKRMIEIDIYHLAADFEDRDRSLSVISLQRGLHARLKSLGLIEVLLRQPAHLVIAAWPITVQRLHHHIKLVAHLVAGKCLLQTANHVAVAMQKGDRILLQHVFENFPVVIAELVGQQHNFVFRDIHGGEYTQMLRQPRRSDAIIASIQG